MRFRSYYKLPAPQTSLENCVAHNGSLIPIPGRDVMVQGWYQGGISVFDWTDPSNPVEIAFHDRGPVDPARMQGGGSWSVYWYNGLIVSSEIARGLDIFELTPSAYVSQNEIDAAKSVKLDYLNAQGQPKFVWPASFALARAYVDQLERSGGLSEGRIASTRTGARRVRRRRRARHGARRWRSWRRSSGPRRQRRPRWSWRARPAGRMTAARCGSWPTRCASWRGRRAKEENGTERQNCLTSRTQARRRDPPGFLRDRNGIHPRGLARGLGMR